MTDKPAENDELFDQLPPLDDDGSTFDGDDDDALGIIDHDRDAQGLDDATREHEPIDAWVGADLVHHEGGWLDHVEGDDAIAPDEDVSLGGDERGLLEGSHEGDGRDVSADEAGIFTDDEDATDDGGAEGTGEDPSDAIDRALLREPLTVGAAEEDELEDETFYDRVESNDHEPWPSRADVAWTVERAPESAATRVTVPRATDRDAIVAAEDKLVAAARFGEGLSLSFDGGERFVQIAGCAATTAIATIPGAPGGRAIVAALWDAMKDASALVVVRLVQGAPVAELVAELAPAHARPDPDDDDDEWARVTSLEVEVLERRIVVVARGRFGALRASG